MERKAALQIFFISIFLCGLISCKNTVQPASTDFRVRAAVQSEGAGAVQLTAAIEGADGNILTGAVVLVRTKTKTNRILQLAFDAGTCCYRGSINDEGSETVFTFEFSSILSQSPVTLEIPHIRLTEKPAVIVFRDREGNSVLNGQNLKEENPIQIAWTQAEGSGSVYQVTIKTAVKTIWSVSTNAGTITIPAYTIPSGSWILEITAEKIYGDPTYRTAPYYSASAIRSAGVYFDIR